MGKLTLAVMLSVSLFAFSRVGQAEVIRKNSPNPNLITKHSVGKSGSKKGSAHLEVEQTELMLMQIEKAQTTLGKTLESFGIQVNWGVPGVGEEKSIEEMLQAGGPQAAQPTFQFTGHSNSSQTLNSSSPWIDTFQSGAKQLIEGMMDGVDNTIRKLNQISQDTK